MIRRRLKLGHSPDPDDAFMFHALARGHVQTDGLEFEHVLQDIDTLNRRAEQSELEVTALSAHAYAFLTDRYLLLNSGASMGQGYGPIVVSKHPIKRRDVAKARIAVPGERTSAFLALRLAVGEFEYGVVAFDKIMDAVAREEYDAGLLIHEGQLTFRDAGLHEALDLGKWWAKETGDLPLPLGVNAIRRDLPPDVLMRADAVLRASVEWGLEHRADALLDASEWGRDLDQERTDRFVAMYVNELTLDYGETGRRALDELLRRGAEAGLLPEGVRPEFVPREEN